MITECDTLESEREIFGNLISSQSVPNVRAGYLLLNRDVTVPRLFKWNRGP